MGRVPRGVVVLLGLSLMVLALPGCSGGTENVSKDQEDAFRNPPKEIPPESLKAMNEARAKAGQMAAKRMKQGGGQGN